MRCYYNEFNPGAAAWCRELIAAGLALSLCEARPDWFATLTHRGAPWGVALTPAGRAGLTGGG